jgi:hypothetical protein
MGHNLFFVAAKGVMYSPHIYCAHLLTIFRSNVTLFGLVKVVDGHRVCVQFTNLNQADIVLWCNTRLIRIVSGSINT